MSRFEELYRFGPNDFLTDEALNARLKDIDSRLTISEIARLSEDEAYADVLDRVLSRSEAVIASLRGQLLQLTELQWLTAHSPTPAVLAIEAQFPLIIREEDRPLFAPGPFAVLSWDGGEPDHYAVVRTLGYAREEGEWLVRVEAFVGEAGPHVGWQISAVAGSTLAQLALLASGQAAAAAAAADRADVAARHADISAKHADVLAMAGDTAGAAGFNARISQLETDAWFFQT